VQVTEYPYILFQSIYFCVFNVVHLSVFWFHRNFFVKFFACIKICFSTILKLRALKHEGPRRWHSWIKSLFTFSIIWRLTLWKWREVRNLEFRVGNSVYLSSFLLWHRNRHETKNLLNTLIQEYSIALSVMESYMKKGVITYS
jgi:hypothetical protein